MQFRALVICLCVASLAVCVLGCNPKGTDDGVKVGPPPDSVLIGGRVVEAHDPDTGIPLIQVQLSGYPEILELTGSGGHFTLSIPTEHLIQSDDKVRKVNLLVSSSSSNSGRYRSQLVTKSVWVDRPFIDLLIQMARIDSCGSGNIEPPQPKGGDGSVLDSIFEDDQIKADSTLTRSALPILKQRDRRLAWL
jgi:hypothetical protein